MRDNCKHLQRCLSIDPAPVHCETGTLHVDCGPSRYGIWKRVRGTSSFEICAALESIFAQMGPQTDILADNCSSFHYRKMIDLCSK
ncbi:hypothetical protein GJ496_011645 [Pomphorhynchus laevis]|nr:hypothetical protein GJ496_011645 [Pomphorhynchus laevis]